GTRPWPAAREAPAAAARARPREWRRTRCTVESAPRCIHDDRVRGHGVGRLRGRYRRDPLRRSDLLPHRAAITPEHLRELRAGLDVVARECGDEGVATAEQMVHLRRAS